MPFPAETTAVYEETFPFGDLDIMATFRVQVEQMPGQPWRITGVEAKTQDGGWKPLIPGTSLDTTFRIYARSIYPQAIYDALREAQDKAREDARNDAGDVRFLEAAE